MENSFVIGVDFGTDSVRSLVVNTQTGQEAGSAVHYYPRWQKGLYCDPATQQYRQHPLDYLEGLEHSIREALQQCPPGTAALVKGIAVDTTGSTPGPVDETGTPLALIPGFEENPNAMFVLWKDHTANKEAALINEIAHSNGMDYTQYSGGIYSSEWYWAKILHVISADDAVREKAASWVEHCDWIPAVLTGNKSLNTLLRSRCAAGHKAMWHASWGGLPPRTFLEKLSPALAKYDQTYTDTVEATIPAGTISAAWAAKLGLPEDVIIGTGAFDAHMGAVGGGIQSYSLCKVIGTSTCDILVAPMEEAGHLFVKGICGQVDGSVIPGMLGLEAGQSAYGDVFAWLRKLIMGPMYALLPDEQDKLAAVEGKLLAYLSAQAQQLPLKDNDPLALDWFNGRRTPDANHTLKSTITGLHLGVDAVQVFKALVEATAFGAQSIAERFQKEGIAINEVIALGGVAKKSGYAMQVLADVMNRPIRIVNSENACALGAAMFAAVAAGVYPDIDQAQQAMTSGFETTWQPRQEHVAYYAARYRKFQELGAITEKIICMSKHYQGIKEQAYEANMQLPALGLVLFTFGNVSVVDRAAGVFAIKPSGVPYVQLSPDKMVIVDFDGNTIEGSGRPSSDTKTHAVLYKHWEDIGGIVHTHSTYATAWAQAQRDIPVYGTTHADHLTADVPCAAPMSDEMIKGNYEYQTGFQIMQCLQERGLSYKDVEMLLVGNHAPFTWGKTADKAVYNAAVLEEVARMAFLTESIRPECPKLKDALIKKHFERKHGPDAYYGQ